MPYKLPDDYPRFERPIGAINQIQPAFTVHVGDFTRGNGRLWPDIGDHPGRASPVAIHLDLPSSRRTIGLIAAEHSPDDARELVGHRSNDDVEMSSEAETIDPFPEPTVAACRDPD